MNIRPYQSTDYDEVKHILKYGGHFDDVWDDKLHWDSKSQDDPSSILVAEKK